MRGYKATLQKINRRDTGIDLQRLACLDLRHAGTHAKLNSVEVIILFAGKVPALTEPEFKATMKDPMVDVTAVPSDVVDIWPYVSGVATEVGLPALVLKKELVEQVYRSGDGIHDHVLLPTEKKNKFVVIVVDRVRSSVAGHHILNLNREYGLE